MTSFQHHNYDYFWFFNWTLENNILNKTIERQNFYGNSRNGCEHYNLPADKSSIHSTEFSPNVYPSFLFEFYMCIRTLIYLFWYNTTSYDIHSK